MNDEDKKDLMKEFKDGDGGKRLEMWDYAIQQQVVWEEIIADMQTIARQQGVDKQLEKLMDEDLKEA